MNYGEGMTWRDIGFGAGSMVLGLVWLAIAIAAVVLVILGIRWLLRHGTVAGLGSGPSPRADDSLEILRQRYAKGEIDEEEFSRRRTILGG